MALEVEWADEALSELDMIITYLEANWSDREIRNFFIRLEECIDRISDAPQRQKNSLRKPGVKEYQHSQQTTIFYNYNSTTVFILQIWSNFRDPKDLSK